MYYCDNCRALSVQKHCEECGNENLNEPDAYDYIFLIEKETIWADMLKEVLEKNEVPYICQGDMGSGMALKVAPMLEHFRFYIPYIYYNKAKDIIELMFSQDNT